MKKTLAIMLALVMCLGLFAGCSKEEEQTPVTPVTPDAGGAGQPEGVPAQPKILKLLRSGEDTVLNPHDSNDTANSALMDYVVSTLYSSMPSADGTKAVVEPIFAAEKPELQEDQLTWTIRLREDAKWPDGQKITADDWIYSWKMSMDPKLMYKTGSGAAKGSSAEIVNALAYYKSDAENNGMTWDQVGIKKVDDYTIEVQTAHRVTQLEIMRHFSSRALGLVRQDIYEKCVSADGRTCDYGSSMDKMMFCGPYLIENWSKGTECSLVRNPDFPLADRVELDGIYTRVVQDESTRLELFEAGECDYVILGTNGFAKYGEDPRVRHYTAKTIDTMEINQNNPDKPYLADPVFRKALFYATDRNSIAKLTNDLPAPYFISTEGQVLDDGTTYRDYGPAKEIVPDNGGYDPELARKYLDEAFRKYGLDKVTLTITYNEDVNDRRTASEFIQSNWKSVFEGKVEVKLQAMNKSAMLDMMRSSVKAPTNTWDISWSGWALAAESYAPWQKANRYVSTQGSRYTTYSNDKLDELCKLAQTDEYRLDDEKLAMLTVEMEKALYEDMTCIPVMQRLSFAMFSERVEPVMKNYVSAVGWGQMWSDIKQ